MAYDLDSNTVKMPWSLITTSTMTTLMALTTHELAPTLRRSHWTRSFGPSASTE